MQPDDPPYAPAAFHKFTKNRKARKPTFRRPYTATHAWLLPTRLRSPIPLPSSKNPTPISTRPATGPANPQPWATPARPCLHRPGFTSAHGHQPAETSGRSTQMRIQPTHTNSRRRRGGHGRQGTASLRDATTLRRLRRRRLEGQCLFTLAEYRKAVECFDKAARPDSGCTTAYAGMVRSQKRLKKRLKRGRCFNGSAGPEPDCAIAQPYRRYCAQSTPEA